MQYGLEDLIVIKEVLEAYLLDFPDADDVVDILEETNIMIGEFDNG